MGTDNGRTDILVGVDGSAASLHAVDWAARIADSADRLTLCCVIPAASRPTPEQFAGACQVIDRARSRTERANHSPAIRSVIEHGHPAAALRRLAADMSFVVLGCPAAARAHRIAGEAFPTPPLPDMPCSVVIARPTAHAAGPVIVGVDESAGSQSALQLGFELASRNRTELCAVHVWHAAGGEELLAEAIDPWVDKYRTVSVRRRIRHGPVAQMLAQESRLASVVVIGHTAGPTPALAADLVALAGCSVAIAR